MNRCALALIVAAGLSMNQVQAAPAMPTTMLPSHCDQLEALVVKRQSFSDGKMVRDDFYPVPDLVKALKACPAEEKYVKAFDTVLGFDLYKGGEGDPGQAWLPTTTQQDKDKALQQARDRTAKAVQGYVAQIKDGELDEDAFKTVLHYVAWQSDEPLYASLGCELAARMYPQDFESVKALSHGLGGEACEDAGKEFLPKTPPKH